MTSGSPDGTGGAETARSNSDAGKGMPQLYERIAPAGAVPDPAHSEHAYLGWNACPSPPWRTAARPFVRFPPTPSSSSCILWVRKIGRASWREGGCQYVEIWVVAVS